MPEIGRPVRRKQAANAVRAPRSARRVATGISGTLRASPGVAGGRPGRGGVLRRSAAGLLAA
jgi:hypothetical protein